MTSKTRRLAAVSRGSGVKLPGLALAIGFTVATSVAIAADLGPRHRASGDFDSELSTYIVAKGDDLSDIAKRFELSLDALKAHNKQSSDIIQVDDKLTVADADADAISAAEKADKKAGVPAPDIVETKAIAEAGFIYGLPIVMNYAVMQEFAVDKNSGQLKAPFNTIWNDAGYKAQPLSAFLTQPAPAAAPKIDSVPATTQGIKGNFFAYLVAAGYRESQLIQ